MRPTTPCLRPTWAHGWAAYLRGAPASSVPPYLDAGLCDVWTMGYRDARYTHVVEVAPDIHGKAWRLAGERARAALERIAHA